MNKQLEQVVWEQAFSTDFLQSEPMTFIRLTYKPPKRGKWLFGIGFARCMDTDEWSAEIGHKIAFGRAVKDIVGQIEAKNNTCKVSVGIRPRLTYSTMIQVSK
jgi:hypothetical protein